MFFTFFINMIHIIVFIVNCIDVTFKGSKKYFRTVILRELCNLKFVSQKLTEIFPYAIIFPCLNFL